MKIKKIALFIIAFSLPLIVFAVEIPNPITAKNFTELLQRVVRLITNIGIALAPIAILYAGILFMTAQGEEAKIKRAKEVIFWAVIGMIVLLSANAIVSLIRETLGVQN